MHIKIHAVFETFFASLALRASLDPKQLSARATRLSFSFLGISRVGMGIFAGLTLGERYEIWYRILG